LFKQAGLVVEAVAVVAVAAAVLQGWS